LKNGIYLIVAYYALENWRYALQGTLSESVRKKKSAAMKKFFSAADRS
jgi:hypothetical protein